MKHSLNKNIITAVLLGFFILCLSACNLNPTKCTKADDNYGFNPNQIDHSVSPSENFYKYAIGNWIKTHPIPPANTSWGNFDILQQKVNFQLKNLMLDAAKIKKRNSGSLTQKVGDFYISGMDINKINKEGKTPLLPIIEKINDIKNLNDFTETVAYLQQISGPIFNFGSEPDLKNSDLTISGLSQGGLGLPEKSYYASNTADIKMVRSKYSELIKNTFKLLGYNDEQAADASNSVISIETKLAESSKSPDQLRDPLANYHPMSIAQLEKLSPNFNWKLYFSTIDLKSPGQINVGQPDFFTNINKILKTYSLNQWKTYLIWNSVNSLSPYLSKDFEGLNFEFYGKALSGQKQLKPRWERVVSTENNLIGQAVGKLYVDKYFSKSTKIKAAEMVKNILAAMQERIKGLLWMTSETKKKALDKLAAITINVGYPKKWTNYSTLKITPDSYIQNIINSSAFNFKLDISKIGKPTDKQIWTDLPPQIINAFYEPTNNSINLLAAILQPPFFNTKADDAINYGGLGAIIGHEITHGFDDQGRLYDKNGSLNNWWSDKDTEQFNERTDKLVKQFNNCEPLKNHHVNGKLTLGENIADLGGITLAYTAFSKTEEFNSGKKINNFTPKQRFFLAWAQVWRNNIRPETLKVELKTNPHSPAMYRVNEPLSNFTPFDKAFQIKKGSLMYKNPKDRIVIW